MFSIGIMQGRISNKKGQPLQSFPVNTWRDEFENAEELGIDLIEWLVDGIYDKENPLTTKKGRLEIKHLSAQHGIAVKTVCAHCFISGDLLNNDETAKTALINLGDIMNWSAEIGIENIILPAMDKMSLADERSRDRMANALIKILDSTGLTLLFESDLPGHQLASYIRSFYNDRLGVLYDVGNANALRLNIEEDLLILNGLIREIHIKDRRIDNGCSCRLGEAGTPFELLTSWLASTGWSGPIVLETPVFNDWHEEASHNISFVRDLLESVKNKS